MIEFGGHHLGLNAVLAGANGVMTPTLTGAQPATYKRDGRTARVLAQENDKAFALLDALDVNQWTFTISTTTGVLLDLHAMMNDLVRAIESEDLRRGDDQISRSLIRASGFHTSVRSPRYFETAWAAASIASATSAACEIKTQ
jgi:hypothetical protein